MEQLMLSIIEITPETMDDTLGKLQTILNKKPNEEVMTEIVKSLFYGLWNFDKMFNQHIFSTHICEMLNKIKGSALPFIESMLAFLNSKWNLIDHHRINKFMQFVRYLIRQGLKVTVQKGKKILKKQENSTQQKEIKLNEMDRIILKTVFADVATSKINAKQGMGWLTILHKYIIQNSNNIYRVPLVEHLLRDHLLEHFRLHLIEHVFQKIKADLFSQNVDSNHLENKLIEIKEYILEMAKKEEKEPNRRNMYDIIGFFKSKEMHFRMYMQQKQARKQRQLDNMKQKKKKISKGKKKQVKAIKQAREKRKKDNPNCRTRVAPNKGSRRKFELGKGFKGRSVWVDE